MFMILSIHAAQGPWNKRCTKCLADLTLAIVPYQMLCRQGCGCMRLRFRVSQPPWFVGCIPDDCHKPQLRSPAVVDRRKFATMRKLHDGHTYWMVPCGAFFRHRSGMSKE
jgi:hypothetical protein